MLSVVIPTLNAETTLPRTLHALVGPTVRGRVREVIIADGASEDDTAAIADAAGAKLVNASRGRGHQLKSGAMEARGDWLLFLHADTVLETGWDDEASNFIERVEQGAFGTRDMAAAFSFRLDHFSRRARLLEFLVSLRCALFALPYGDQGLLISKNFYDKLGGYQSLPLMEDVDMIRRIGRRRLLRLRARAVTSAARYERDGFFARAGRNLSIIALYFLRVPPRVLARLYG